MLRISIKFKDSVIKTIETDSEKITIGRYEKNNIQIDNLAVSSLHARIVKEDDNYYIEDLESTNGTFLNDIPVKKEQLRDTDAVTIGKHIIVINIFPDQMRPLSTAQYLRSLLFASDQKNHISLRPLIVESFQNLEFYHKRIRK